MITEKQKEIFQHICFGVLMESGIKSKSPAYIAEKMVKKNNPITAWQMLHPSLQNKVKMWANYWKFPLNELLEEFGI